MEVPLFALLEKVRSQKPVIHHLTNFVTIYDCAALVKAFGASPVMAHAVEEVAEMAQIASGLVLNIGTLTSDFLVAMKVAAASANKKGIPVVLDVCGAGATAFRDKACLELIEETRIAVIKGNASEIARISGKDVRTKGVDSEELNDDLRQIARSLARQRSAVVVITGKDDIVDNGTAGYLVSNGDPLMAGVVGTGCMAASSIATFAAVEQDLLLASAAGLCCYEVAAECAAQASAGPGTFRERLFDAIGRLDQETLEKKARVWRI